MYIETWIVVVWVIASLLWIALERQGRKNIRLLNAATDFEVIRLQKLSQLIIEHPDRWHYLNSADIKDLQHESRRLASNYIDEKNLTPDEKKILFDLVSSMNNTSENVTRKGSGGTY